MLYGNNNGGDRPPYKGGRNDSLAEDDKNKKAALESNERETMIYGIMIAIGVIIILNLVGHYINPRGSSTHNDLGNPKCPTCDRSN